MSEDRNFDDFVKKEFNNYSPGVPAHIWENIVAKKKKRKPVGFWLTLFDSANLIWLLALLLAGSIGAALIASHFSTKTNTVAANTILNNNATTATAANATTTTNNNSASYNNTSNKKVISSTKNDNTNSTSVQSVTSQNNLANKPDDKIKDISIAPTSSAIKESVVLQKKNIYLKKRNKIDKNKTAISAINNDKDINASTEDMDNHSIAADVNEDANTVNTTTPVQSSTANNTTKINYLAGRFVQKVDKLSFAPSMDKSLLQLKNITGLPECPTIEKDAAGNKKYFEIYIAPDYAVRSLTDTANSAYLQKREASTKLSSAFSAGIRYTRVFNNGVSVRAGLNYSQINEIFSYIQGNVVQVTYTIDPVTGDTTGSYTVRGTRYKTTYNHYRSIDVPLTIGYELGNGRFHTNINAGVIANIYSWQQGDELDTNSQPVSITTGKGSTLYQFRTNIGLGLTGGASFYYKLTDQLHFLAEPYIRYNFQPLSTDNFTLRQKYTTIGLRIGLRFDLPDAGSANKR